MTKLYFDNDNCFAATSAATGNKYYANQGFINVENKADLACLTSGGYHIAGGMPRTRKYYVCECGWEAAINSCPKCQRNDLTKVEK